MKINITIETKDRRLTGGQNYLRTTLQNMRRAGVLSSPYLNSLTIVSGGELPDYYETEVKRELFDTHHEFVHCPEAGCTRQQNGARAIRYGAMNRDGDWVLKLEDDLDFLDDFLDNVVRWLSDYGHLPIPMFVLGSTFERVSRSHFQEGETFLGPGESFPHVRTRYASGYRILGHAIGGWYAAQALLWQRPVAEKLAEWLGDDPALFDGTNYHRHRGHDLLLQVWGQATGAKVFGCSCPSFVQHIGRQSNLNQPEIGHVQPFFEFPFPGREWRYERVRV